MRLSWKQLHTIFNCTSTYKLSNEVLTNGYESLTMTNQGSVKMFFSQCI
jgi:hypothetical protein